MVGVPKCVIAVVAAAVVSACAVSESRPNLEPGVFIDAGITGNPEIAGAQTTIEQVHSRGGVEETGPAA